MLPWTRTDTKGPARLPPRRTGFNPRPGHSRIFASGNSAGRRRWSAGFLENLPFPPPLHSGTAPFSSNLTFIGYHDRVVRAAHISQLNWSIANKWQQCGEDVPDVKMAYTQCEAVSDARHGSRHVSQNNQTGAWSGRPPQTVAHNSVERGSTTTKRADLFVKFLPPQQMAGSKMRGEAEGEVSLAAWSPRSNVSILAGSQTGASPKYRSTDVLKANSRFLLLYAMHVMCATSIVDGASVFNRKTTSPVIFLKYVCNKVLRSACSSFALSGPRSANKSIATLSFRQKYSFLRLVHRLQALMPYADEDADADVFRFLVIKFKNTSHAQNAGVSQDARCVKQCHLCAEALASECPLGKIFRTNLAYCGCSTGIGIWAAAGVKLLVGCTVHDLVANLQGKRYTTTQRCNSSTEQLERNGDRQHGSCSGTAAAAESRISLRHVALSRPPTGAARWLAERAQSGVVGVASDLELIFLSRFQSGMDNSLSGRHPSVLSSVVRQLKTIHNNPSSVNPCVRQAELQYDNLGSSKDVRTVGCVHGGLNNYPGDLRDCGRKGATFKTQGRKFESRVRVERRRNAREGETGAPRENPPTNGIVRQDSHLRKFGSDQLGIEPVRLGEGDQANRSATEAPKMEVTLNANELHLTTGNTTSVPSEHYHAYEANLHDIQQRTRKFIIMQLRKSLSDNCSGEGRKRLVISDINKYYTVLESDREIFWREKERERERREREREEGCGGREIWGATIIHRRSLAKSRQVTRSIFNLIDHACDFSMTQIAIIRNPHKLTLPPPPFFFRDPAYDFLTTARESWRELVMHSFPNHKFSQRVGGAGGKDPECTRPPTIPVTGVTGESHPQVGERTGTLAIETGKERTKGKIHLLHRPGSRFKKTSVRYYGISQTLHRRLAGCHMTASFALELNCKRAQYDLQIFTVEILSEIARHQDCLHYPIVCDVLEHPYIKLTWAGAGINLRKKSRTELHGPIRIIYVSFDKKQHAMSWLATSANFTSEVKFPECERDEARRRGRQASPADSFSIAFSLVKTIPYHYGILTCLEMLGTDSPQPGAPETWQMIQSDILIKKLAWAKLTGVSRREWRLEVAATDAAQNHKRAVQQSCNDACPLHRENLPPSESIDTFPTSEKFSGTGRIKSLVFSGVRGGKEVRFPIVPTYILSARSMGIYRIEYL
ncbi:hypothetical protein PR048_008148 [Dryococelus australis]|uniref:Uncharacterized protein n=1 Tax=Dryococelus australis TaxID=614101 RepID=A0ABQ9HWA0_9NEOP|nr:hypothetical protein PR048_008148 [Dryococelus australis]